MASTGRSAVVTLKYARILRQAPSTVFFSVSFGGRDSIARYSSFTRSSSVAFAATSRDRRFFAEPSFS